MKKKKAPQDSTLRNVRAAKNRLVALGRELRALTRRVRALERQRSKKNIIWGE